MTWDPEEGRRGWQRSGPWQVVSMGWGVRSCPPSSRQRGEAQVSSTPPSGRRGGHLIPTGDIKCAHWSLRLCVRDRPREGSSVSVSELASLLAGPGQAPRLHPCRPQPGGGLRQWEQSRGDRVDGARLLGGKRPVLPGTAPEGFQGRSGVLEPHIEQEVVIWSEPEREVTR